MAYDEEPNNEGKGAEDSDSPGFLARQREKQAAKSLAKDEKTLGKGPSLRERATGQAGSKRAGAYERQQAREKADLQKRLGSTASGLAKRDAESKENDSFFKTDKKGNVKKRRFAGLSMSSRAAAGAAGAGGIGVLLGIFSIFSFLGNFQLEHILNNIDSQTFSRFNASFDGRSNRWMQSYVKLRLSQFGGDIGGGESYAFRSFNVQTGNPATDWYRTLRANRWEQELFDEKGIIFTTRQSATGIDFVELKIGEEGIPFDVLNKYADDLDLVDPDNRESILDFRNKVIDTPEFGLFFDEIGIGDSPESRSYLKGVARDKFASHEVLKRRHFRKWVGNMNGVRDWRFFDKTRTRIDKRKANIQSRIIQKVFSGNGNINKFMGCLLDPKSPCMRNSDPVNPETQNGSSANRPNGLDDDSDRVKPEDPDLDGDQDVDLSGTDNNNADEIADAARKVGDAPDVDAPDVDLVPSQKLALELRKILNIAGGPAKAWKWMTRIATIDTLIREGGPGLVALGKVARTQNLVAAHTTLTIARDQLRTGEVDGQDVGATMALLQTADWGNSEGWATVNSVNRGSVEAQAVEQASKNQYCDPDYDKKPTDFAWFCDSEKPNGSGGVEGFIEDYKNTVGIAFGPIASVVNDIDESPLGQAINFIADKAGAAADGFIRVVGLDDEVENLTEAASTKAMGYLLEFFGLAPDFDGSNPGQTVNYATAGSAGSAESATRSSGGVASTPESRAYTTQLAVEAKKIERDNMSLYERYASIDNHESVAARSLFSISTNSMSTNFVSAFKNIFSFSWAKSFFISPANAQAADAADIADWAGVDKYDIPQVCVEMDPLSMTIYGGTNFDEVAHEFYSQLVTGGGNIDFAPKTLEQIQQELRLSWDDVRDSEKFYEEVYKWVADDMVDDIDLEFIRELKAELAPTIYNCHILDTLVQDSLGFTSGYNSGTGYDQEGSRSSSGSSTAGPTASCPTGTNDLGVHEGFKNKQATNIRLCAIPNLNSTAPESNEGNDFYIINPTTLEGANGKAIVNAEIASKVLRLVTDAKADGQTISLDSGWRSMEAQRAFWIDLGQDKSVVAEPGTSNHQMGLALDIAELTENSIAECESSQPPLYVWLTENISKYGFEAKVAAECWHWASTGL